MSLTAGQTIAGRYHIEGRIGSGGIGTVYRAIQSPLDRPVALKMLRPEFSANVELRRRFHREARAVAALSHPNIAVVHDFGTDEDDQLFMALELVEGESLEALGEREGLSLGAIAAIFGQVLTGLAHAHARGVIHRDIKPANVLVSRDEDGAPTAKIVDFGIASVTGVSGFEDTVSTGSGVIVGTPQYMAPEQARGDRAISASVDVYAVGLTLYWALSGRHAFDGESPMEVLAAQLHEPPPTLSAREGLTLPEGLSALVHDALAKSPRERIPSAIAFRTRLETVLGAGAGARIALPATSAPRALDAEALRRQTVVEVTGIDGPALDDTLVGEGVGPGGPMVRSEIPLVGRRDERARLLARTRSLLELSRGHVLTLEAPSGYGKSRIATWLLEQLAEHDDVRVVHGAFLRDSGSSLRGVRDAFERLLGLEGATIRRVSEFIAGRAAGWGLRDASSWQSLITFLRPSATREDERGGQSPEALFETLYRILETESADRPVALHLDDVHWGGMETARFLEFIASELVTRPADVLVVATVLTGELATHEFEAQLRHLRRFDGDTAFRHALAPLSDEDAHELIRAILPVSDRLAEPLVERAEGNEMHLVQLLRYLADRRLLVPGRQGWEASEEVDVEHLLPPSLSDLVVARLHDLERAGPAGQRRLELLRRGAVLGGTFPFMVLERMLQAEARSDLLETIDEDIDALLDLGLLELRPGVIDDTIGFAARLVRDVLLERMKDRRTTRRLHLFAADAKIAVLRDGAEKVAGELVVHFEQARDYVRAFRFARIAARVAERSHRPHEAVEFIDRALEFLRVTGEVGPEFREAEHELRLQAAHILVMLGEYPRARRQYTLIRDNEPGERNAILAQFGLAKLARIRGAFDEADAGYRRGLELARAAGDDELLARGDIGLARVEWHRGRHDHAYVLATEALELARRRGDRRQVPEALWLLADVARSQGDHASARSGFEEALALYEADDDRQGIAKSHAMLAMSARAASDLDRAEQHYVEALRLYREYGDRKGIAHQLNGLGEVYRFRGDFAHAARYYREAVELFQRLELPSDTAIALTNLGIVARESGDFGRSETELRRAFDVARTIGHAYVIVGAGLSLAHVLAMLGRFDESDEVLADSLRVADAGGIVDPDFAVPLERLADLRASQGDGERSIPLLERAQEMWTELGRARDEERVTRRLSEQRSALDDAT